MASQKTRDIFYAADKCQRDHLEKPLSKDKREEQISTYLRDIARAENSNGIRAPALKRAVSSPDRVLYDHSSLPLLGPAANQIGSELPQGIMRGA